MPAKRCNGGDVPTTSNATISGEEMHIGFYKGRHQLQYPKLSALGGRPSGVIT